MQICFMWILESKVCDDITFFFVLLLMWERKEGGEEGSESGNRKVPHLSIYTPTPHPQTHTHTHRMQKGESGRVSNDVWEPHPLLCLVNSHTHTHTQDQVSFRQCEALRGFPSGLMWTEGPSWALRKPLYEGQSVMPAWSVRACVFMCKYVLWLTDSCASFASEVLLNLQQLYSKKERVLSAK